MEGEGDSAGRKRGSVRGKGWVWRSVWRVVCEERPLFAFPFPGPTLSLPSLPFSRLARSPNRCRGPSHCSGPPPPRAHPRRLQRRFWRPQLSTMRRALRVSASPGRSEQWT